MSDKPDGGQAFPVVPKEYVHSLGMSLRDYFAAAALQGFACGIAASLHSKEISKMAYECADDMLKEREK